MSLINCKVNLILTWSSTCVITNSTGAGTFAMTDTRTYVPVVTLSTQENTQISKMILKEHHTLAIISQMLKEKITIS